MTLDLPLIFGGVIAFAIFMYVLMDGFDLGVGILFRFAPSSRDRDVMMNSVAPIWDGNETWLVLGGGGLLAAFPVAYSILMPALYLPVMVMLIALVFRGVAFEFRFKARTSQYLWDHSFHWGSAVATFAQGVALGAFVQGFAVEGRAYAGGPFDWLTAFSVATGLALIAGYGLLGATWLVWKTEGPLQQWSRGVAKGMLGAVLLFMATVSLWTPLIRESIAERWFTWPNIALLSPVPIAAAVLALALYRALVKGRELAPFVLSMLLFLTGYVGLGISLWPNVVPPSVTLWEAAAAPESQAFLLVGVAVLMPVILGYTAYAYWVFRGKASAEGGYH
jgi:cytochrome bd ubiquinol oxidase subunit II